MENAYVSPPPLPPQAHLSAAFQQAVTSSSGGVNPTAFQEALMSRMGRPFGLTSADMKDLPGGHFLGLAAAARGVGPGGHVGLEGFPGGLPGALALSHHMSGQPGFGLHHFMDPRLPFSAAGAFRPIFGNAAAAAAALAASSSASVSMSDSIVIGSKPKCSSAFQPPKSSPPTLFSPGQNLYPRGPAGSPGSPSSSPPSSGVRNNSGNGGHNPGGKLPDENSNMASLVDRHDSISPASMDEGSIHDQDERAAKKIRLSSSSSSGNNEVCCCPICGMPLRISELEMHYSQELEYLTKLSASLIVSNNAHRSPNNHSMINASPNMKNQLSGSMEVAPRSRWDTFQRIQRNRQSRIRVKLSRRAGKRSDEILEEDVIDDHHHQLVSNHHDLHHHLQLQQQRAKMEQPQSSSTPAPTTSSTNAEEEDIDIVGNDDGNNNKNSNNNSGNLSSSESSRDLQLHVYGPPQFTEADVLQCMSELNDQCATQEEAEIKREVHSPSGNSAASGDDNEENNQTANDEDVKRIKEDSDDKSRCSKCLKSLKDPVVNVGCWHVQCEKCWLSSLGTKKSCSLCCTPTVPADLRRVFL